MSSFLNELWLTEKSYTVVFKETSLCSSVVKSFDMRPKQKLFQLMLSFALKFTDLCFIYIQVTFIAIIMQT